MWGKFDLKSLNKTHPIPDPRGFSFLLGVILIIIGLTGYQIKPVLIGLGAGSLIIALMRPSLFSPLNQAWHYLGLFLGWLMTPLILTALYFLFFVPISLIMKLFGHKGLAVKGSWIFKNKPCRFERIF